MCRIFAFRSILQSQVHKSLLNAENALISQSENHPDGWGLGFYKHSCPHVIKMGNKAGDSDLFQKVSGIVRAQTVLAHIRKSTIGGKSPLNTHPFQFGPWTFVHNGNLINFDSKKNELYEKIHSDLRPYILGDTDSESIFYYLLTILQRLSSLDAQRLSAETSGELIAQLVGGLENLFGAFTDSNGDYDKNYLTFVLTNGSYMLAFQGGQKLRYSTYKANCSERHICDKYATICESPAVLHKRVHHLLISSEEIVNENVWTTMKFGEYVGVQADMSFFRGQAQMI